MSANRIAQSGELDRRREQRGELAQHRLLRDHRLAEVAVEHAADVDAVLDEHRPVEPVFLEQRRVPRGVDAALARHGLDRIARHDPDQEEREQRHADEGRDDEADSAQQEAQHLGSALADCGFGRRRCPPGSQRRKC